jgi:hypothetical protein
VSHISRSILLCGLFLGFAKPAGAQTETRAAVAEALYRQARDFMAAGKYDEACPKFAQSQKLDPATGTLLNLAACHEKQGRLATAWLEYSDAQVAARRDAREDRVEYARTRAQELEPKLSRLTLSLATDADDPTLSIELDGASVGREAIGAPTPVDSGKHTVRATANGKRPWTGTIEVGASADQQSLVIPKLEDAPAEPPPATTPATTPATFALPPAGTPQTDAKNADVAPHPIPSSVYVAGGITLALGVSAIATGVAYLNKRDDYETRKNDSDAEARRRSAQKYGYLNIGMWAGAALGAGVTSFLFVTRPSRTAAQVTPWAGPQGAGLSVTGGF